MSQTIQISYFSLSNFLGAGWWILSPGNIVIIFVSAHYYWSVTLPRHYCISALCSWWIEKWSAVKSVQKCQNVALFGENVCWLDNYWVLESYSARSSQPSQHKTADTLERSGLVELDRDRRSERGDSSWARRFCTFYVNILVISPELQTLHAMAMMSIIKKRKETRRNQRIMEIFQVNQFFL